MLADVSEEQWIVFVPQKERRVRLVDGGVRPRRRAPERLVDTSGWFLVSQPMNGQEADGRRG